MQRVSGFALIFLVGVHMWMGHFSGLQEVLDGRREELVLYEVVKLRLAQTAFIVVDFALLAFGFFIMLLGGLRSVIFEWGPAASQSKGGDPRAYFVWNRHIRIWFLGSVAFHPLS
ncbi:MAG: hypothetical protein Ct9H300mP11_28160 [Chloroflexota bacterium]|nr:MAG: hypothetical protein Ct9H300mP11_28160 [Chloroflexota bacterium]